MSSFLIKTITFLSLSFCFSSVMFMAPFVVSSSVSSLLCFVLLVGTLMFGLALVSFASALCLLGFVPLLFGYTLAFDSFCLVLCFDWVVA